MTTPPTTTAAPHDPLTPMTAGDVRRVRDELWLTDPAPQPVPAFLEPHVYEKTFTVAKRPADVWRWLNDPATFADSQIWPFRVEFVSPDPGVPAGFHEGVLNTHHGPLLNFAGVMAEVRPPEYRDLRYFYGAYAISPRLIRPTRLQFWTSPSDDGGTTVRLRVDSLVRRGWGPRWTRLQGCFWTRFPKWVAKAA